MDDLLQKENEMQDEELYALLNKALDTERLCVSEDLIQKTLKRVAEQEDSKIISFEKAAKRRISPIKYVGVAAAALFVAVLGVSAFRNGGMFRNDTQMDATAERVGSKADGAGIRYDSSEASTTLVNSADVENGQWHYSRSGDESDLEILTDKSVQLEAPEEAPAVAPKDNAEADAVAEGEVEMSAITVELSQMLAGVLKDAGMAPVSDEAECWEFADAEKDWERELLNCLAAGELWGNQHPEYGTYRYVLEGKDGISYVMEYNEPLDLIVRIETERGALWGLLGAGGFFFTE